MFLFYWLVAVMPLENHWLWGHVLFGTFTVIKVLGLFCLFIAGSRLAASRVSLLPFCSLTTRWILVFTIVLGFAAIQSLPQSMSQAWSHVLSIISLFITVLALVTSHIRLNRTLLIAIGAAGFASLYTIRQQQHQGALYGDFRAGGMSGDPNYYAMLVGLWGPLAFLWVFSRRPLWERLFCCGCLLAILAGYTVAASRGGFIGLAAASLYLIFRSTHRARNFLMVGMLSGPVVLALFFVPSSPLYRFTHPTGGDQFSSQARLISWKCGIRMVEAHPLTGVGLHNFQAVVLQYQDPSWLTEMNNYQPVTYIAHNTYIELASEAGLPGLLFFLVVLGTTFRSLEYDRRRAQVARHTHVANIALGLQAGLVCFAVGIFFLSDWWERMFWLSIFLAICLHRLRIRDIHRNIAEDAPKVAHSIPVGA